MEWKNEGSGGSRRHREQSAGGRIRNAHLIRRTRPFGPLFRAPKQRWPPIYLASREEQEAMLSAFTDWVLNQARSRVPAGFSCETMVTDRGQDTASALLDAAGQSGSDLIVVGAGRSSRRLPFYLGGVARTVIHQSTRPVLAYRQSEKSPPLGPLKLLLAVDPAESTDVSYAILNQFCWPLGSHGQLIHVLDYVEDERLRHWINHSAPFDISAWNTALDQELEQERDQVRQQLNDLQQRLPTVFQSEAPLLTLGHVVERIVETVERTETDLVIVGGHRPGLIASLLGSTTEGVLLQANASVLVLSDGHHV